MRHQTIEADILNKLGEYRAAGLYEERNASTVRRHGRGFLRYSENITKMPKPTKALYPTGVDNIWNLDKAAVGFHYSSALHFDGDSFNTKIEKQLECEREINIARSLERDLQNMVINPLSTKFRVGGMGYTHSIVNYQEILSDGLPKYEKRINDGLTDAKTIEKRDLFIAAGNTFKAVLILLKKSIEASDEGELKEAFINISKAAPTSFYEALVLMNFIYYIDGTDTIGELDRYLAPFYKKDIATGVITPEKSENLLSIFFENVDLNSGWHMILGGAGVDTDFTALCLRAQNTRRPNSGLKITPDTPDTLWEEAFNSLQKGTSNPAFYNDVTYREGAVKFAGIAEEDLPHIAYGGCTEFMVAGRANVGSIDSGLNLLQILEGTIISHLGEVKTFEDFLAKFKEEIRTQVKTVIEETDLNQQYKGVYRPQLIRTIFTSDCLKDGVEFNQGGARYNGGVVNVAGISNTANSLYAIKQLFEGTLNISAQQLLASLANDFKEDQQLLKQLTALPKFGNNFEEVDALAHDVTKHTFSEITSYRCWRKNGFYIPSTIMFVTYVGEGEDIGATPDGRRAGSAIADSCGPMQGTDTEGPTSRLSSTSILPQVHGLGTMILNMRVNAQMFTTAKLRQKLKSLIKSYFKMGGLQVQLTVLDNEQLKKAMEKPEEYENLIVRIGGYTEYFNRLDDKLKLEVISRTEHI